MNEQELRYLVGEAWKGTYNANTTYGNANVVQDPTGLSVYRSLKPGNAGHPLTDTTWWFCIIDLSSIKNESDRIKALNDAIAADEAQRVSNEQSREQAEQGRVSAENARVQAEQGRVEAEQQRVSAEQQRANAEQTRVSQEQSRVNAEQSRVSAEQGRVAAEQLRVNAENQRAVNEENRVAAEQERVLAEQQRISSEQARQQSESERQATFVQSQQERQAAFVEAEAQRQATFQQNEQQRDAEAAALQTKLENGDVIPALAENLEGWKDADGVSFNNEWDETIRTTAGDNPIETDAGGVIQGITAKTDFSCTGLRSTAYNQLRLVSNGGGAVAVGTGWYFPVPKLEYGAFGNASKNNGLLLTDNEGNNIQSATVYFKPLASGVPTSVTDGTAASYQTVNYGGKSYKTYLTSGPGWLIVSGITYANTCAHIAWEDWYDKFVSPTDAEDNGDYIALSALFTAAPNGTGKFIILGNLATSAARTDATHMLITDPIGRIASPSWTNTADEVAEGETQTYTHTLTISNMKSGGQVKIEGSTQSLSVDGNVVSYSDTNETAISGAVRYELMTAATATVTLAKTSYSLNDCGVEVKEGAVGEGYMTCEYSQNIPDLVRACTPQLSLIRYNNGAVGQGYGVCVSGTYDAAKIVAIDHFLLLKNAYINVLFTTPINTENTTLNVSGTGAKPIRILGQNLPSGVIKAETVMSLQYDGDAWNIINIFCPDNSFDPTSLWVDMGLPSGLKWAKCDIDLTKPGGFCETPFIYDKSFFSWGNIDGHNPKNNSFANVYNWGSVNAEEPWYDGQPYGSTPGNTLTASFAADSGFDAARENLGAPWRMPISAEFAELFNSANTKYINADGTEIDAAQTDKRVTVNGVMGLYIESKVNGNRLFFSCSGNGGGQSWGNRGSGGYYWSSTWFSARSARYLYFDSGGVYPQYSYYRYYGFAVRAVQ